MRKRMSILIWLMLTAITVAVNIGITSAVVKHFRAQEEAPSMVQSQEERKLTNPDEILYTLYRSGWVHDISSGLSFNGNLDEISTLVSMYSLRQYIGDAREIGNIIEEVLESNSGIDYALAVIGEYGWYCVSYSDINDSAGYRYEYHIISADPEEEYGYLTVIYHRDTGAWSFDYPSQLTLQVG